MPSISDNVKYWKVSEDDLELKFFLETVDEFYALHIDQDHIQKSLLMMMFSSIKFLIIILCSCPVIIYQRD
jgi:hypothetical protein